MKTRISAFCDDYKNLLTPIDRLVERVIERIDTESRGDLLADSRTRLSDACHRFHSLREKIEHQQAYLIIFGPLKSGKSTLMNAISGTYVSEVTAMPAYPCLVYVSHGDETAFSAIKYNGSSQEFADNESLNEVLEESHSHLATRIRMHELEGEEFDPRIHYTEAVRRIDVRTPVPALREASTVLVDTPGLYSRMKFGYDLMTREFRNSAACAVFVVRSDNLFLDQVFDEFTDLLDEFSRIFLVVNIDSSKRDLRPDGSLGPSIESSDPDQIIEAFKSLSMTAPLREAYETGRLQIYAVDLLNAAAGSLSQGAGGSDTPSFDHFLSDLTEYLNSSDYQREFERDSLKQGATICAEVREACDLNSNEDFQEEQTELKRVAAEIPPLMEAIDELSGSDLAGAFDRSRSQCLGTASDLGKRASKELQKQMIEELNRWMENDTSLQELSDGWSRAIKTTCDPITKELPKSLASRFDTPTGGADLSASVVDQLQQVELDLDTFVRPAAAKLKKIPAPACEPLQLDQEQITVNRSFLDRILFRSMSKTRTRLFGPASDPQRPIPSAAKRKRLAEKGFLELHAQIDAFLERSFPDPQTRYVEKHADAFIGEFRTAFEKQLGSVRSQLASDLDSAQKRLAADDSIFQAAELLDDQIATIEERIGEMQEGHLPEPDEDSIESVESGFALQDLVKVDKVDKEAQLDQPESEEETPITVVAKNKHESFSTEC